MPIILSRKGGGGGGGGAPSGPAGGDLTGTYPNPTLAFDTIEVRSLAITFATAGLTTGVTVTTLVAGDVLWDFQCMTSTAWNGTTPKGDFGTFTGGTSGFLAEYNGAVQDMTSATPGSANNPELGSGNGVVAWMQSTGTRGPFRVNSACTIKFIVTQSGLQNGADPGANQGAAILRVLVIPA